MKWRNRSEWWFCATEKNEKNEKMGEILCSLRWGTWAWNWATGKKEEEEGERLGEGRARAWVFMGCWLKTSLPKERRANKKRDGLTDWVTCKSGLELAHC